MVCNTPSLSHSISRFHFSTQPKLIVCWLCKWPFRKPRAPRAVRSREHGVSAGKHTCVGKEQQENQLFQRWTHYSINREAHLTLGGQIPSVPVGWLCTDQPLPQPLQRRPLTLSMLPHTVGAQSGCRAGNHHSTGPRENTARC